MKELLTYWPQLLTFLILCIPTAYELWDDRHGEGRKDKEKDVPRRAFLMTVSAGMSAIILWPDSFPWRTNEMLLPLGILFLKLILISFAIFLLTFDYLINVIFHKKERVWYSYLSKSPLDKLWSEWNWRVRMAIRVTVFLISLYVYTL